MRSENKTASTYAVGIILVLVAVGLIVTGYALRPVVTGETYTQEQMTEAIDAQQIAFDAKEKEWAATVSTALDERDRQIADLGRQVQECQALETWFGEQGLQNSLNVLENVFGGENE